MTNTQLTYLRTIVTAIITTLTALLVVYPHATWSPFIAATIAGGSAMGIHAIPSISQSGDTTMTEQPLTGSELMGLTIPKPVEVTPESERPETPDTTPKTAQTVTAPDVTSEGDPSAADLIDNVIAGLQKISAMLRS